MKAIRGAITVKGNSETEILKQTERLLREIIRRNWLTEEKIVSIFFSATADLTKAYPARAARNIGLTQSALACYTEMEVEGTLSKCIRVLMHVEMKHKPYHVYLDDAKKLRPDWEKQIMQIAIDGPSGAGKSTIAKELAKKLEIVYVDTGAMYRSLGLLSLRQAFDLSTKENVLKQKEALIILAKNADITWKYQDGRQILLLDSEDISDQIRTQEIGDRASKISTIREVRQAMVSMQREIASNQSVVMDGRDIGTVVLPDADYKIFLTASAEVRGRRRQKELEEKGMVTDLKTIITEIIERDERDQTREESPLKKADDAVEVNTSDKNIDEVVKAILDMVME